MHYDIACKKCIKTPGNGKVTYANYVSLLNSFFKINILIKMFMFDRM